MQIGDELVGEPAFARKRCATDGLEYTADVAEDKDLIYLIENSCIHCNKLIKKSEVKILPPSYIQQRDPYVSKGVVKRRMMCLNCYNTIRSVAKDKVRFDRYRTSRAALLRSALGRMFAR